MLLDSLARFIQIVPIGLASGLMSGAFGVGGGIITVPLIRDLLGVTAHVAVGNSLAVILPTAVIGALNYLKQRKLEPLLALSCGGPAVVGTVIGSAASLYVHGQYLMLVLSGLMILVGLDFVTGFGNKLKAAGKDCSNTKFELNRANSLIAAVLGLLTGLLSGMLGVGGGFIMVPAFCYFLSQPLKVAFGTSLIVVALVALPGTVIHAMEGHVQLRIVLPILTGSLPGAWFGSYFALKSKDKSLRVIFGLLILLLAVAFACRELTAPGA
jgi:hypothetical protein